MRERILITGGSGFIGTHLIDELLTSTDFEITVVTRNSRMNVLPKDPRVNILELDIAEKTIPLGLLDSCSIVVHLASKIKGESSRSQVAQMVKTNILGTMMLFESVRNFKMQKCILFSTAGVYKDQKGSDLCDELSPTRPINLYTATKLSAELVAQRMHLDYGLPLTIVRPSNVYGPRQAKEWMIPLFISRLIAREPIYLNHRGSPKRDWIFISDLVQAIIKLIQCESDKINGEIFNIGSGTSLSNLQIAGFIALELNRSADLIRLRSSGKQEHFNNVINSNKIITLVDWKPRSSFLEGLRKTIRWYVKEKKRQ